MRKRLLLSTVFWLAFTFAAQAQPVQQSGNVTPLHVPMWTTNGVIQDGGTAASGNLSSLGVTATGAGICQNSGPITGNYNQLCLSVDPTTGGQLAFTNFGGAGGLSINVNGTITALGSLVVGQPITGTCTTGQLIYNNAGVVGCQTTIVGGFSVGAAITGSCTNGYIIYNNAGVIGCEAVSGTGTVTSITAGTGLSGGTITTSGTIAIANTAVAAASYGSSTSIPSFTVNAQGQLTTAAGNVVIAPAGTLSGTTLNSTVVTSSLTSVGTLTALAVSGTVSGAGFSTYLASPPAIGGTVPAAGSFTALTATSSFTATGLVTLAAIATQAANTALVNATSGTASPTAQAVPSCSAAGNALNWTTNTGLGCNTSITAAAVPASGLTGTTLASNVVTSSLTTVGTIGTGTWQGTVITGTYGGTGINNGASTITVAGNFVVTTNGGTIAFPSASTTMTMPAASDTLGGLATSQTWTAQNQHNIARTIASGTNAVLQDILVNAATTTVTGTTAITGNNFSKVWIGQPTITDASAVTITNAASFYIDNAPAAAGMVTISNPWAIYVSAGNVNFPGGGNRLGTISSGTWNGSAIGVLYGGIGLTGGTSGGILGFTAATTIASSGVLTANNPVIGGGAGATPSSGTRSGNTTVFGTTNGTMTSGDCVSIDGNGNLIDAGGPCTVGGGGGTVASSTVGTVPVYTAATVVTGNTNFTYATGAITLGSVGGGVTGALKLAGLSSGTFTMTVGSAAGTWTLTQPNTAGTSGQLQITDGTGIMNWATRVTSVATGFGAAGGPITTTGTVTVPLIASIVPYGNV